jgi:hypothetical protein
MMTKAFAAAVKPKNETLTDYSRVGYLCISIYERIVICINKAFLRKFQYEEPERNVINTSIEDVCSVL